VIASGNKQPAISVCFFNRSGSLLFSLLCLAQICFAVVGHFREVTVCWEEINGLVEPTNSAEL
jgi:hypothetical protein